MKQKQPSKKFWTMLSSVNLLALIYPIKLLIRAESMDENFFAICALVGSVLLLVVVDAVSILVMDTVAAKRQREERGSQWQLQR